MARLLIALGLGLVIVGLVWLLFPRALAWFGHLPGDIRVQREGFSLFVPITSMLVLSGVLSLLLNLLAWLMRR